MSLEDKVQSLTLALQENTAALLASAFKKSQAEAKSPADTAPADTTEKKPRGRPAGSTKKTEPEKEPETSNDGLGDDDGLGDLGGDDDGLGGLGDDEPKYTFDELKKMMMALRDIGGKEANKDDCKAVILEHKLTGGFLALDGQTHLYNAVADSIKKLAAKKKVKL